MRVGGGVAEWLVGGSMAREGGVPDLERLGRGLASLDMTWAGRAGHDLGLAYNFGFGGQAESCQGVGLGNGRFACEEWARKAWAWRGRAGGR